MKTIVGSEWEVDLEVGSKAPLDYTGNEWKADWINRLTNPSTKCPKWEELVSELWASRGGSPDRPQS